MGEYDVGQPIPRTEDPRLLTGGGRYSDDYNLPHQLRAYMLRSPHAHADIKSIDIDQAVAMPGVQTILTAADYRADGHGDLQCGSRWNEDQYQPPNPPLALGRVRHVGEAVVMVIADTIDQAKDAAEAINVEYAELPANTVTAIAMDDDTPAVWEHRPNNECFYEQRGYPEETKAAFENADVVVERTFPITRTITNTIEPRAYLGDYNSMDQRYTLYTGCHYPHKIREQMALEVFGVAEQDVRVIAGDVGGSFGLRGSVYPEQVLVMWASRRVGKPVKWTAERSEAHLCDYQGRDNYSVARLALDKDGNFRYACADARSPWVLSSPPAATARPSTISAHWRAPTGRLLSMSRCLASSPTQRRPVPIAAPDGRKQPISSKRWSKPAQKLDAIPPICAARTRSPRTHAVQNGAGVYL